MRLLLARELREMTVETSRHLNDTSVGSIHQRHGKDKPRMSLARVDII